MEQVNWKSHLPQNQELYTYLTTRPEVEIKVLDLIAKAMVEEITWREEIGMDVWVKDLTELYQLVKTRWLKLARETDRLLDNQQIT